MKSCSRELLFKPGETKGVDLDREGAEGNKTKCTRQMVTLTVWESAGCGVPNWTNQAEKKTLEGRLRGDAYPKKERSGKVRL